MERKIADDIVSALKALDEPLNRAMGIVEGIADTEQRAKFRKALARVVGLIYTDLYVPIGREYSDLLPDEEDVRKTE